MLDLFAGRLGWSKAFLARGWEVVAYDLVLPDMEIPAGVDYRLADILTLTPADVHGFDFICASSPCEQFSVHGMKHFHPNPKFPEMGLKLFNHTRMLCESSGVPYVMENVRPAQNFVGNATHHCGPFYLWGTGVPALLAMGVTKTKWTSNRKLGRDKPGNQCPEFFIDKKVRAARLAAIPPELASSVADYAERICKPE